MPECSTFACTNTALPGLDKCRTHAPVEVLRELREAEERAGEATAPDHRQVDGDGMYGCKVPGCSGRSKRRAGPTAYLCDDHLPQRAPDAPRDAEPAAEAIEGNGHRDYRAEAAAHLQLADALTAVADALERLEVLSS